MNKHDSLKALADIEGVTTAVDGNIVQYRFTDSGALEVEITTPDGEYFNHWFQLR